MIFISIFFQLYQKKDYQHISKHRQTKINKLFRIIVFVMKIIQVYETILH